MKCLQKPSVNCWACGLKVRTKIRVKRLGRQNIHTDSDVTIGSPTELLTSFQLKLWFCLVFVH